MNIDTGKALIGLYNKNHNIILIDIYAYGELNVSDMASIHKAVVQFYMDMPMDTICVKSGCNYLSDEALDYINKNNAIYNKIVYVIKHMVDIHFPSEAQNTYFKDHMVDFCASVDEAYHLIKKH